MTKQEKEIAAMYISACMNEMRKSELLEDPDGYKKAHSDYMAYSKKLRAMLEMKFEMFGLDYEKCVTKPIQEVYRITQVFYSQRVNGEQLKYPA